MDDIPHPATGKATEPFFIVPRFAWERLRQADCSTVRVYLELANMANADRICWPSAARLAATLGIHRGTIFRALDWLVSEGLIDRQSGTPTQANVYQLAGSRAHATSRAGATRGSRAHATGVVAPARPKQEPVNKNQLTRTNSSCPGRAPDEEKKKSKQRRFSFTDEDKQTAEYIWQLVQRMAPEHKAPSLEAWANDVRLMRERDGRTHEAIRNLFAKANADSFWRVNVRCPAKLREHWDTLQLKQALGNGRRDKLTGAVHNPNASEASTNGKFF